MEYDIGSNESVSGAVIRAVSALEGRERGSMRPLTEVLDPDALDALFAAYKGDEPRVGGRVSFVYEHCRVTVDNAEFLTVRPLWIRPRSAGDGGPIVGDAG